MLSATIAAVAAAAGPVTREGAADAAREELSRPQYADAQPSLVLRLVGRALRALADLLDTRVGQFGEGLGQVAVLVLLAVAVGVVLVRLGPLGDRGAGRAAVFDAGRPRTAGEHRAEAETLAGQGRLAEAIRERLRAVVRELEARGVLDPRPGRTAGEVARDAGRVVPALADDLGRAAAVFDEVWYGGRPASPQGYALLVQVDELVTRTRVAAPA
ncbi:MAG TPA: DUF4129 domain-containing protein [Mycobacteriales bacterium]|nr:DUF4129 domain-containing protein [Mycobacteriales bacterium]